MGPPPKPPAPSPSVLPSRRAKSSPRGALIPAAAAPSVRAGKCPRQTPPRGCPPAVGEGGGGLAPSGAPSHPLPRMEAGAGGGRGQPPVPGPAAGFQMCSPDARPQGLPLARKRPPQPPRRGGNGVGGTRDLQLGPAHGATPSRTGSSCQEPALGAGWGRSPTGSLAPGTVTPRSHRHPVAPCPGWEALGAALGDSSRDRQGPELWHPRDVKGTRWPRVPDHSACQGAAGCCGHPSSATSVCWPGMSPGSAR